MIKVIVAGSRDFKDYNLLKKRLIYYLSNYRMEDVEIVSGGARGADTLGERFAEEMGCNVKRFIPDWSQIRAGHVRNWDMARYADFCIVFWDRRSKGTEHMIETAERLGLRLKVVTY